MTKHQLFNKIEAELDGDNWAHAWRPLGQVCKCLLGDKNWRNIGTQEQVEEQLRQAINDAGFNANIDFDDASVIVDYGNY